MDTIADHYNFIQLSNIKIQDHIDDGLGADGNFLRGISGIRKNQNGIFI